MENFELQNDCSSSEDLLAYAKKITNPHHRLWFKLYMLINYPLDKKTLVGIGNDVTKTMLYEYRYGIRTIMRKNTNVNPSRFRFMKPVVEQFILDGFKPFDKVAYTIRGNKIRNLVKSSLVNQAQVDFIYSDLLLVIPKRKKNYMIKEHCNGYLNSKNYHEKFVKNYQLPVEDLYKIFPNYAKATVVLYKRQCELLNRFGADYSYAFNKGIKEQWLLQKSANTTVENKSEDTQYKYGILNTATKTFESVDASLDFLKGYQFALSKAGLENSNTLKIVKYEIVC